MKEIDFINTIKEQIGNEFIGDDCAYLKELGIVITQDSFLEDVHFKKEWYTPNELGYKAVAVNISDILASGAKPKYITIALSLPNYIDKKFVENFYIGAKDALFGAEIVGGDITGSDKIFISITAIGSTEGRNISSRSNAKPGYKIITNGTFGLSSKGLDELMTNGNNENLISAHKRPLLDVKFSEYISTNINVPYAMMDTSDGLADALYKIAKASDVSIVTDDIDGVFGSEDYILIAAVPNNFYCNLQNIKTIAYIENKQDFVVKINGLKYKNYDDLKTYNHFGGLNE